MARARSPVRDKLFEIWKQHKGEITNRAIAEQLQKITGMQNQTEYSKEKKVNKEPPIPTLDELIEDLRMTEKQSLFCIYYVKSFNTTQAAIKAGYAKDSAHVQGSVLLRNPKVAEEIRRIKSEMIQGLFVDAMDVLDKYIKIAFADITDYTTFGKKEVPVIGMRGTCFR